MIELKSIQVTRLKWLQNYLGGIDALSAENPKIINWICQNCNYLGLEIPKDFPFSEKKPTRQYEREEAVAHAIEVDPAFWRSGPQKKRRSRYERMTALIDSSLQGAKRKKLFISPFEQNLTILKEVIGLEELDRQLILVLASFAESYKWDLLFDNPYDNKGNDYDYYDKLSLLLGVSRQRVIDKFGDDSILRRAGLVYRNELSGTATQQGKMVIANLFNTVTEPNTFQLNHAFLLSLKDATGTPEKLIEKMIGPQPTSKLTLANFDYVGPGLRGFVETVRGALKDRDAKGKAFCIYGPPGVGKTELLAVISAALDTPVHLVGLSGSGVQNAGAVSKPKSGFQTLDGFDLKEPTRNDRIEALMLAQYMAKVLGRAIILGGDEAEDLFNQALIQGDKEASKGFTNKFLDEIQVPTIFITNRVDLFEEATVRRILPAIPVMIAPEEVRLAVLFHEFAEAGIEVEPKEVKDIQARFPSVSPGVLKRIVRSLGWREDIKDNPAALKIALMEGFEQAARALNKGITPVYYTDARTSGFDYELANTDIDLAAFAKSVGANKGKEHHFCFIGPDGVGRRQFAYHLADIMGYPILKYPYSLIEAHGSIDTARCFEIFEQARIEKATLLFEGAEVLIANHDSSAHDVYLRMKHHHYPVIAISATIGAGQSAFKGFDQIIAFRHIDPYQRLVAFKKIFGFNPPPEIQAIPNLTYGQLVVLKDKMKQLYNGTRPTDEVVMKMVYDYLGNPWHAKPRDYKPPLPLSLDDDTKLGKSAPNARTEFGRSISNRALLAPNA
jgi:DNA polymerase III delta prime subunit